MVNEVEEAEKKMNVIIENVDEDEKEVEKLEL